MIKIDRKHTRLDFQRLVRFIAPILLASFGFFYYGLHNGKESIQSSDNCITIGTGSVVYLNPVIQVEPIILPYQQPNTGVK